MARKNYIFMLTDQDRKRHVHVTEKGAVTEFAVQYEIMHDKRWLPVVRYDTAHGYAHKDLLNPDGTREKTAMGVGDYSNALTFADKDIDQNWMRYRERFLRRLK